MNYKRLIADAYDLTTEHPRLHWFGFWPSLLDILVGGTILFYQGFATLHHFFKPDESILEPLKPLIDFAKNDFKVSTIIAILALVVFLLRLFVPVICNGGLIFSLSALNKGQEIGLGKGFAKGLMIFLPLFELTVVLGAMSPHFALVETAFAYRNMPPDIFTFLLAPLGVYLLFTLFASFSFIYAEFFMILEGKGVAKALSNSFRLVWENLKHTFVVGLLMLTIGLRIILSVALILLVPLIIVWMSAAFFASLPVQLALGLAIAGSILLLYFSSRLLGAVTVLVTATWTMTFTELRAQQKEEDAQLEIE